MKHITRAGNRKRNFFGLGFAAGHQGHVRPSLLGRRAGAWAWRPFCVTRPHRWHGYMGVQDRGGAVGISTNVFLPRTFSPARRGPWAIRHLQESASRIGGTSPMVGIRLVNAGFRCGRGYIPSISAPIKQALGRLPPCTVPRPANGLIGTGPRPWAGDQSAKRAA